MENIRSIEDIVKRCRESVAYYDFRIALWEAVEIKTKKNGEEFAELSNRCIEGAKLQHKSYSDGFELYAGGWSSTPGASRYEYDTLNASGFCDELPEGDPRKKDNDGYLRTQYLFTPAEAREKIAQLIEKYNSWKLDALEEIAWLEQHKSEIEEAVKNMRAAYIEPASEVGHKMYNHLDSRLSEAIGYMLRWGVK